MILVHWTGRGETGHMPAHKKLPENDELTQLLHQGWSYADLGAEYGVSREAIYKRLRQIPGLTKPRPRYTDTIPWKVAQEHTYATPVALLRLLGRQLVNQAEGRDEWAGFSRAAKTRLTNWLAGLDQAGLVVTYGRDIPPNPASPDTGGWAYVPRLPEDDSGYIRRPVEAEPDQPAR